MDRYILWGLLFLVVILLILSLRKPPTTHWLLIFFMKAYFSTFIGIIVVEKKMLEYPVRFLPNYFDASILFEYLIFPVLCIYYYQTTYHSRLSGIIIQTLLYTTTITALEVIIEKFTDLIEYYTWTWLHTFSSVFLVMIFIRGIMELVRNYK
ncbi:CBO0543 family protein [Aquibacillus albus]|uniref:Uncharacterized protein n=1 Tax=Aquibacillus albus TaxID=1168171 RepID=A0ABS2N3M1_9BACI|nr:CBO0543 family protein [Aquibacillus albus]MBM7572741.1 hypothetical protein [Aquibacillus albus]